MSRLINASRRLFLLALLLIGFIVVWERVRTTKLMGYFRSEKTQTDHLLLKEITTLGKLELVKYTFKDIVEHEQVNAFLPNANAVLIVEGEATGCIDLTKITASDITSSATLTTIRLPKPELCSWKINHDRSRVYDTHFSFLNESQLVSDAYRTAEQQVRQSALHNGILPQTERNANRLLKPLLERIAGNEVSLVFQK